MKKDKEEILSRREFFQKAVQKTLPIMGVLMFGQILNSCGDNLELSKALNSESQGSGGSGNGGGGIR